MATIAWIGIILLPTSIVATVISAIYENGVSATKTMKSLGILLAVSIPMTVILIFVYRKLAEPQKRRVL
jgi:cytochrome bd-type quinol oxidase subunit 2